MTEMIRNLLQWLVLPLVGLLIATQVAATNYGDVKASDLRLKISDPGALRLHGGADDTRPPDGQPTAPPAQADTGESKWSSPLTDQPYAKLIDHAARDAQLDPALVHAVIFVESRYNPNARSPKGALGLMQVMPETASRYGVRNATRSIEENLKVGTRYLADLMQQFAGQLELVLAAYNAGEKAVLRYGLRIPPFQETQRYVPSVLAKYLEWRKPPVPEPPPTPAPVPARKSSYVEYLPGTRIEPAVIAAR